MNDDGRRGKITNREKLLKLGLRLMHERGLAASVREIVKAAGVPQGSFTNHFASKEAFCVEILNLYHQNLWKALSGRCATTPFRP